MSATNRTLMGVAAAFRKRRFPHLAAWLLFFGWALLVGTVPTLRVLDQEQVGFYCLRGVTLGLLIASMANFAQVGPRREPRDTASR